MVLAAAYENNDDVLLIPDVEDAVVVVPNVPRVYYVPAAVLPNSGVLCLPNRFGVLMASCEVCVGWPKSGLGPPNSIVGEAFPNNVDVAKIPEGNEVPVLVEPKV